MSLSVATEVRGLRETLIELRNLDKSLYDQLNSDIKNAALPYANAIKSSLPTTAPLSGFNHNGATAFKTSENKTAVKTGKKKPRGKEAVALLKVVVSGAGLAIADMAGHNNSSYTPKARSKPSNNRPAGYRINGQGAALESNLRKKSKASRYVWPAALKNQNLIDNSIERSLQEASAKVNRNLLVVK